MNSAAGVYNKTIAIFLVLLFTMTVSGLSHSAETPDTYENRLVAARSYFSVMPMERMTQDLIEETAKKVPENVRADYIRFMKTSVRLDVINQATMTSMAQHFTVREIRAMTAFYGTSEGRSIARKFGAYWGDVEPTVQQEMARAMQQLKTELQKKR